MIGITNVETYGWDEAIRGMRNSWNSWDKSDSSPAFKIGSCPTSPMLGENDLELMYRLAKAGGPHAKYRRMITVYMDISAPLYWWKEFDTYKVGTVANSCSTMHTIMKKPFDIWDFSTENLTEHSCEYIKDLIEYLNEIRDLYLACDLEENKKRYWWQVIQLLPSSYMQKRTVMLNYEVLGQMYKYRWNHKLPEWRKFCEEIELLPYSWHLIPETRKENDV